MASARSFSRTPATKAAQKQGRVESVPNARPLVSNGGGVVRSTQHAERPAPRAQSDYEAEHYGGDAKSGSDLERMRSGGGLATGRKAPRVAKRVNAASATLVDRGLASSGDVDANQGRLFSHAEMGNLTKSDAEMSEQTGVGYRRPAGQGYLTGVGQSPTQPHATVAAARAAGSSSGAAKIVKRRKDVTALAAERLGTSTPSSAALESRQGRETDRPTDWYNTHAGEAVNREALKSGMGSNPQGWNQMRRATALMSPQKAWDSGHGQDGNYKMDNVALAGEFVRHQHEQEAKHGTDFDPQKSSAEFKTTTPGLVNQSGPMRSTVARHLGQSTASEPSLASGAQKVRNFDLALAANHQSKWARRQAGQAYTSDTHDARAMGDKDYDWIGSPSSGGYEFAAMTGRRGAMRQSVQARRNGTTPRTSSEYQEDVWNSQRNRTDPSMPSPSTEGVGQDAKGNTVKVKGRQALTQRGKGGREDISPLAKAHPAVGRGLNANQFGS